MIDETNAPVVEASGRLKFRNNTFLLEHVKKHICSQRHEKWWKHPEFNSELISAANRGNENALILLARAYQKLLNEKIAECCEKQVDHEHWLNILPKMPSNPAWEKAQNMNRKPYLIIKFWIFPENLVIILSARVKNDEILPYIIKTGYKTSPGMKKETWLKRKQGRDREKKELNTIRKNILLADHMN